MKSIKLMPDYSSYPLWDLDDYDNIDPATLPLSDDLRARLAGWSDVFDAVLNQEDPGASDFATDAARAEFDAQGFRLWQDLAAELGPGYCVSYHSVVQHRTFDPAPV